MSPPLDLDRYLPFYWTVIANRWTASSSRSYRRRFGIGVAEWRLLATLSARGEATALDAVRLVGIDPAAASRAMGALLQKGLVNPVSGRFRGRNKPYQLTPDGVRLSEQVHADARDRLALLLGDLSEEESEQLLVLLRRVHARTSLLEERTGPLSNVS